MTATARIADDDEDHGESITAAIARMQLRAEQLACARLALPCHDPHQAGRIGEAVEACAAAGAHRSCAERGSPSCPRSVETGALAAAIGRMRAARVPGADVLAREFDRGLRLVDHGDSFAAVALAALSGRRDVDGRRLPAQPPLETDALALVRAFTLRQRRLVCLSGPSAGGVDLRGNEWVLVLAGSVGVGKSFAAAAALRDSETGLYVTAEELARGPECPVSQRDLDCAGLLVLDDLGQEPMSASRFAEGRIAGVLDGRYAARRPTIVTTNLRLQRTRPGDEREAEGILERYGRRLRDRIDEGVYVPLVGASLRGSAR